MKICKCIKELEVPMYNERGEVLENSWLKVHTEEEFEFKYNQYTEQVRLYNSNKWIDLTLDKLEEHFEII